MALTQSNTTENAVDTFRNATSYDGVSVAMPLNQLFSLVIGADAKRDGINANTNTADALDGTVTSVNDSFRENRRAQKENKKKNDGFTAFAVAAGTNTANLTANAFVQDETTREAIDNIRGTFTTAATAVGGASALYYTMFGAEAGLAAKEIADDARHLRRTAGEAAETTAETAAKNGTRVAGEVAEQGAETAARSAANLADEGAELASRGIGSLIGRAFRLAKGVPILGSAVTAGFVAYEVYTLRNTEHWDDALRVGLAETVGGIGGFVGGNLAREFALAVATDENSRGHLMESDARFLVTEGANIISDLRTPTPGMG